LTDSLTDWLAHHPVCPTPRICIPYASSKWGGEREKGEEKEEGEGGGGVEKEKERKVYNKKR
jgi:hypothetical protein